MAKNKNFSLTSEIINFDFIYANEKWMSVSLTDKEALLLGSESPKIVLNRFQSMLEGRSELRDIHGALSTLSGNNWLNCLNLSEPHSAFYVQKKPDGLAFRIETGAESRLVREFELKHDILSAWVSALDKENGQI